MSHPWRLCGHVEELGRIDDGTRLKYRYFEMTTPITRARVLFPYFPNDDVQISLQQGDMISVYEKDVSGWWHGLNERSEEEGVFPSTYVEELDDYLPPSQVQAQPLIDASSFAVGLDVDWGKEKDTKKEPLLKTSSPQTRYGMWANNMCMINGFGLIIVGIAGLLVDFESQNNPDGFAVNVTPLQRSMFVVALILGTIIFIYEYRMQGRKPTRLPVNAAVYTTLGILFLITTYTLFSGVIFLIAAQIHLASALRREEVKPMKKKRTWKKPSTLNPIEAVQNYITNKRNERKIGKEVFLILFIGANIAIFLDTLIMWYNEVERRMARVALDPELELVVFPFTFYLPWARAFGSGLNFAATIILLPVCRTLIRGLYNYSTQDQTRRSRILRRILWLFPLDKALHFHEKVGWLVLFYSFGHTFAHVVNAGLAWPQVIAFYGWSPLISGFLLWVVILFMYSAVFSNVKHGHFEIFWYSHQLFAAFIILAFYHGRGTFGPNYWKWLLLPGSIYLFERGYRYYSAYQTVELVSVTNMENRVYAIEISKSCLPGGYKEGQYVYLNAPYLSKGQWHPFTISSAPDDETITLHIKVVGEQTWTGQLLDYLTLMGPDGASYFSTRDEQTGKGRTLGPSGEKILRCYGPHAAPTEHVSEYLVAIIIGSGIGVTPVASTMQQIVFHRWKYNVGESFPNHAYFVWVCSARELADYRWMIRIVKEAQDEVYNLRVREGELMASKTFEVYIYVTSVKDDAVVKEERVHDDASFWGRPRKDIGQLQKAPSLFSEMDLYKLMQKPPSIGPDTLGDVHVFRGRPKWETVFDRVSERHVATKVGVPFCGNPRIASDLKLKCRRYTDESSKQYFQLHKENF